MGMLKRTSVFLDAAELRKLIELSEKLDRPVAWLIRRAVSELLAKEKP
jgi:predicted transcriptional regulator